MTHRHKIRIRYIIFILRVNIDILEQILIYVNTLNSYFYFNTLKFGVF